MDSIGNGEYELKQINEIPGPTWADLFTFIEKNLQMIPCKAGRHLELVKLFCKNHNLDFQRIALVLTEHGGHCDCEVLLNAEDRLWEGGKLWFLYSNDNPDKWSFE